jgi:rRNA-processing protein FCF1
MRFKISNYVSKNLAHCVYEIARKWEQVGVLTLDISIINKVLINV